MASVDGTVCVRRAIVQDESIVCTIISRLALPLVQIIGAFRAVGFQLSSTRSGWE
jgi:hypothetical protein